VKRESEGRRGEKKIKYRLRKERARDKRTRVRL